MADSSEQQSADTVNNNTQISSNWRDLVPEKYHEWDEMKQSESAEQFFDQVANMRSLVGSSIRVPSDEAGDEAWGDFYSKVERKNANIMRKPDIDNDEVMNDVWGSLGRPDTPAKYDLPELNDYSVSDSRAQQLKEMAHGANLTKKQFKKLVGDMLGSEQAQSNSQIETVSNDRKALSTEWGEAMESRSNQALSIAKASGAPQGLVDAVAAGKADKATMQWLYNMSKQMTTEGNPMATLENHVDSPMDIQQKIDDMMNNTEHAYWNGSHPQHDRAVQKMLGLRKQLAS